MCLASKYIGQIEEMLVNLKSDIKKLSIKQSEYDKTVNEYYHKLETTKFNACEGYYIAKNFQEVLQKRRLVKSELYRMQHLYDNLKIQSVDEKLPQVKKMVNKSKSRGKEWCTNFNYSFSDIEEEVMH